MVFENTYRSPKNKVEQEPTSTPIPPHHLLKITDGDKFIIEFLSKELAQAIAGTNVCTTVEDDFQSTDNT